MRPSWRDDQRLPPLPKPYGFVRFPRGRRSLRAPNDPLVAGGHDRYASGRLTGAIEGTLVALSPVHVASGGVELAGGQPALVRGHFRREGVPTIPGSSLKGCLRSIVEAITDPPSCVRITKAQHQDLPDHARTCRNRYELCPACLLFGAMDYMGRVRFLDAALQQGQTRTLQIPPLYPPRPRENVYYEGSRLRGRKFYMHGTERGEPAPGNLPVEVCEKGARFRLQVEFENLSRAELGLLLIVLGQGEPALRPKLGGGKPACCGSMEVRLSAVTTRPDAALDFDDEPRAEDIAALVAGCNLVAPDSLAALAELLKFPGERPCPDRNY